MLCTLGLRTHGWAPSLQSGSMRYTFIIPALLGLFSPIAGTVPKDRHRLQDLRTGIGHRHLLRYLPQHGNLCRGITDEVIAGA